MAKLSEESVREMLDVAMTRTGWLRPPFTFVHSDAELGKLESVDHWSGVCRVFVDPLAPPDAAYLMTEDEFQSFLKRREVFLEEQAAMPSVILKHGKPEP